MNDFERFKTGMESLPPVIEYPLSDLLTGSDITDGFFSDLGIFTMRSNYSGRNSFWHPRLLEFDNKDHLISRLKEGFFVIRKLENEQSVDLKSSTDYWMERKPRWLSEEDILEEAESYLGENQENRVPELTLPHSDRIWLARSLIRPVNLHQSGWREVDSNGFLIRRDVQASKGSERFRVEVDPALVKQPLYWIAFEGIDFYRTICINEELNENLSSKANMSPEDYEVRMSLYNTGGVVINVDKETGKRTLVPRYIRRA